MDNTVVILLLLVGMTCGFSLHNFIDFGVKKKTLSALTAVLYLSLSLVGISLYPATFATQWVGNSPLATTIYLSLTLLSLNLITLQRYMLLTKDRSLKITRIIIFSGIICILSPAVGLFLFSSYLHYLVFFSLALTILGYALYLYESIDVKGAVNLPEQLPTTVLLTLCLLFFIQSLVPLMSWSEFQWLWLAGISFLTLYLYWQYQVNQNEQDDEETVDSLNQALADQNFELQVTLRELKEKNHELEKLNTLDALSGIHNRRHFDKRILAELRRTRRELLPLSLVMFDIDHFKSVNDTYGHLVGDEVIRSVALTAAESLQRSSDEVFRYGGEEFALILPNTDKQGAFALAEKIRIALAEQSISSPQGPVNCTASFGVGFTDSSKAMTPKDMISQADDALYEAKKNGRNQVVIYSSKETIDAT